MLPARVIRHRENEAPPSDSRTMITRAETSSARWPCSTTRPRRMREMTEKFRVGLTRDILDSRGEPAFGRAALDILDRVSNLQWEYLPAVVSEIGPDLAANYDALYVNIARVPASAVE